jgi:hypothetical protein
MSMLAIGKNMYEYFTWPYSRETFCLTHYNTIEGKAAIRQIQSLDFEQVDKLRVNLAIGNITYR